MPWLRQLRQQEIAHRGRRDLALRKVGVRQQDRPGGGIRGKDPVRSTYQRGVEEEHVQEVAEAQRLLQEGEAHLEARQPEARIEEQLDRVVARLAMDVD